MFPDEEIQYHTDWRARLVSGSYKIEFTTVASYPPVYATLPTETTPIIFHIPKQYQSFDIARYIEDGYKIFNIAGIAANKKSTDYQITEAVKNVCEHVANNLKIAYLLDSMVASSDLIIERLENIDRQLTLMLTNKIN